ncbi:hypothetical protein Trydic_g16083 [Trypoxylus dichotomus]
MLQTAILGLGKGYFAILILRIECKTENIEGIVVAGPALHRRAFIMKDEISPIDDEIEAVANFVILENPIDVNQEYEGNH